MPNFGIFRHLTNDFQKKKAAREKAALYVKMDQISQNLKPNVKRTFPVLLSSLAISGTG
jgi:hypothetical protein